MTAIDEAAAPVLVVRRNIAVPRQRVFDAWLDSESMAHWMRPGKVTHSTVSVDPRVGGRFRVQMHGGDGECFDHKGEYLAIEPPSLAVTKKVICVLLIALMRFVAVAVTVGPMTTGRSTGEWVKRPPL